MDEDKAELLFEQLRGEKIEGIFIDKFLGNGKSAAVYRGTKNEKQYAIKIFDTEIIKRFGNEIQQARLKLELNLKEHKIDNLVKILNGGKTSINNIEYFYLIMGFIEGINLKEYIENNTITIEFIVKVINVLIDVTEKLFQHDPQLVHRDIKPENIMVSNNGEIFLMDLGVIKIVGNPSLTDVETKQFLGTLRYAPPEFIERKEEDSKEGWRAVNIYQIGAVLHDLIMKKELFIEREPYTNLVLAIKEDMPKIVNENFHPDLIQLARDMLQKNWKNRLKMIPIERINYTLKKCLLPQEEQNNYNTIKANALKIQEELADIEKIARSKIEKENIMCNINSGIWNIIDECFNGEEINEVTKEIESSKPFRLDMIPDRSLIKRYRLYQLTGKFEYGFAKPYLILFCVENNESNYCKISVLGIIPDSYLTKQNMNEPEKTMYTLFSQDRKYPAIEIQVTNPPPINFSMSCIFDGIIELEENNLKYSINQKIALILKKVIQYMKPDVREELKRMRERIDAGQGVYVYSQVVRRPIFVEIEETRKTSFI